VAPFCSRARRGLRGEAEGRPRARDDRNESVLRSDIRSDRRSSGPVCFVFDSSLTRHRQMKIESKIASAICGEYRREEDSLGSRFSFRKNRNGTPATPKSQRFSSCRLHFHVSRAFRAREGETPKREPLESARLYLPSVFPKHQAGEGSRNFCDALYPAYTVTGTEEERDRQR